MSLNQLIEEFLLERGALKVGFATLETLQGGPPSVDLSYKLPGARSAISFALPFNRDHIRAFLAKQDRSAHEADNLSTNIRSGDISWQLSEMLKKEGRRARRIAANTKYRTELEGWQLTLHPDLSHRYIAARSGVGSFGWSGNVGIKGLGTAIILGATVTDAELMPTDPLPEDQGFCDKCKLCVSACAVEMFANNQETEITLGGVTFKHAARRNTILCQFCCGGFTGLAKSGKWSTWSPGRFKVPDDPDQLFKEFLRAVDLYAKRPPLPGGYDHPALKGAKQYMTCGNCQISCFGDKKETAKNLKLLHNSGCVLQKPDGTLYARSAEEAGREFASLDPEHKKLYY